MLISRDEHELYNFKQKLLSSHREKSGNSSTVGGRDVLVIACDLRDSWSSNYILTEMKRNGRALRKVFYNLFDFFICNFR